MKRVVIAFSVIALSIFMLGGACIIPSCKAKWEQGRDFWELGGTTSQYIMLPDGTAYKTENADDFECKTGKPVNYVTWYGVHCLAKEVLKPEYLYQDISNPAYYEYCDCPFIIRFYDDNGKEPPDSLPVGEPIAEYRLVPGAMKVDAGPKTGYFYLAKLDPPFHQEEGKTYWISIILDCGDNKLGPPPDHPQWFWQFSEVQWHDYPAQMSEYWYNDTDWHSLYHEKNVQDDMAFCLWYEEPKKPKGK